MAAILIVENERIVAEDIQMRLQSQGYTILAVVSSGKEALQKIGEVRPSLVLMDISFRGDIEDMKAAEVIRTQFDIPVVCLTAYVDEKLLKRAKITKPYRFLLKPLEDEKLFDSIEKAIQKK